MPWKRKEGTEGTEQTAPPQCVCLNMPHGPGTQSPCNSRKGYRGHHSRPSISPLFSKMPQAIIGVWLLPSSPGRQTETFLSHGVVQGHRTVKQQPWAHFVLGLRSSVTQVSLFLFLLENDLELRFSCNTLSPEPAHLAFSYKIHLLGSLGVGVGCHVRNNPDSYRAQQIKANSHGTSTFPREKWDLRLKVNKVATGLFQGHLGAQV